MAARLMEGSEAIAEAMTVAGCRFFAGYPMTPFTEVLEHMAKKLPPVGGVCMNAESELEAVGMAWGAAATGTRSATGSTGQGLSLMQESITELSIARLPVVVLNMARSQAEYWQATRGGGHGDWRRVVLAPMDVVEATELVQRAFHLADRWRKEARNDRPLRTAWGHVPSWEDVTAEAAPTPGPEHLFGALAEQLWAPALRAEVE